MNGEAIYDTKVWRTYGEGPTEVIEGQFSDGVKKEFTSQDIRYTVNGSKIYATALRESETGEYAFTLLGARDASRKANFHGIIQSVEMLGYDGDVAWNRDEEALHVKAGVIGTDKPVSFRITLS